MSDWTPQLSADGVHYCTPACGGGKHCKKVDYDTVASHASALAEKMGNGWKPVIWENLGWHYKVVSGSMAIYAHHRPHAPVMYQAYINVDLMVGTSIFQIVEYARDPQDALGIAKQKAWAAISAIKEAIAEQESEAAGGDHVQRRV